MIRVLTNPLLRGGNDRQGAGRVLAAVLGLIFGVLLLRLGSGHLELPLGTAQEVQQPGIDRLDRFDFVRRGRGFRRGERCPTLGRCVLVAEVELPAPGRGVGGTQAAAQ